jgi:predicted outer membrane repeat protein
LSERFALLQQAHKALYGSPAPPALIKHLLVSNGTAQAGDRHLGPLPDLNATLNALSQVYYVDDSVVGGLDNGTSWGNAFRELQEALQLATPGARILVAEGLYRPDWNPVNNTRTNTRTDTFQLKNGVTLLGGYPNGGGTRNPDTHVTALTGEILSAGATDNSLHVVTAGLGTDESAVLDGFTVKLGYANGGAIPHERGAGILLLGTSSPTLRRLVVQQNFAQAGGGGIYNPGGAPSLQRVTLNGNSAGKGAGMWNADGGARLTLVTFSNNVATGEGGGFFSEHGSPHLENSRFLSNRGTRGGGLSNWPGSSLVLDSVEFLGNQATTDLGGGILNWQGQVRLNNVTMSANSAPNQGGGIYVFDPNTVEIRNSILWANTNGNISGAMATVAQSIVQGGYTGAVNVDPLFRVPGSDLRLKVLSPALDSGGNPLACAATDVRGVFREDACDMGAYEYRGNPGNAWTNGEVDLLHAGESHDSTPVGGAVRQSADDFVVPAGRVCDVTGFRGVLQDETKVSDAVAKLYANASGMPGTELASWSVHPSCLVNTALACDDTSDCPVSGSTCSNTAPTVACPSPYVCQVNQCVSPCVLPGQSLGSRSTGGSGSPTSRA